MPVVFVERVAGPDGLLLPAVRALRFSTGFSLTSRIGEYLTGAGDAAGSVVDYVDIEIENAAVTFAAVQTALGAADDDVSFNGQGIDAGEITGTTIMASTSVTTPILYQGTATSGSGSVRWGSAGSIYGAGLGTPTVADKAILSWNGDGITFGNLASSMTINASSCDVGVNVSVSITAGGGISSFNCDENDTTCRAANGTLYLDGSAISEYGGTGTAQCSAITQSYSTISTTLAVASTSTFTGINNAQGGTPYAKVADLEQLRADLISLAGVLNTLVDYFQARGTVG